MDKPHLPARNRGFSLPELLAVVCVIGALIAIAAPSLEAFGNKTKLAALSEDLLAHLHLARSESIKRRGRVALCKSADGAFCTNAGSWDQGWIVFYDADNNGVRNAGEPLLQQMGALPQGWRLAGNSSVTRYVSYDASGGTRMTSGAFQAGTLTLCHMSGGPTEARQIVLNAAGRPRVQKTTVANCL